MGGLVHATVLYFIIVIITADFHSIIEVSTETVTIFIIVGEIERLETGGIEIDLGDLTDRYGYQLRD